MESVLFHVEVFVPEAAKAPVYEGKLRYSEHARRQAESDRYGEIVLPEEFNACNARLIEAEVLLAENRVVKQVWRQSLDAQRDLVLVITDAGVVKTVWINLVRDQHKMLNRAKYVSSKAWRRKTATSA